MTLRGQLLPTKACEVSAQPEDLAEYTGKGTRLFGRVTDTFGASVEGAQLVLWFGENGTVCDTDAKGKYSSAMPMPPDGAVLNVRIYKGEACLLSTQITFSLDEAAFNWAHNMGTSGWLFNFTV